MGSEPYFLVFSSVIYHALFYVDFRSLTSPSRSQNGHFVPHESHQRWWRWQWHWWKQQPNIHTNPHLGFLPTCRVRLLQSSHCVWSCREGGEREQKAQAGTQIICLANSTLLYFKGLTSNHVTHSGEVVETVCYLMLTRRISTLCFTR